MVHSPFSLLPHFSSAFLPFSRTLFPPDLFPTSSISRYELSSKRTGLERLEKKNNNGSYLLDSLHTNRFCSCGRRHFIGFSATSLLPVSSSSNASDLQSHSNAMLKRVHPPKPDWYEEFFALVMEKGMASYEEEVGEALPANDASMDAVIGTLVLCSVKDVKTTLKEVKRVLKPGGLYVFMEHVAAEDGSQICTECSGSFAQLLADGCHLTRETGKYISEAGFSDVNINKVSVSSASYISPHVYGTACK
ncbi:hypothetical protein MKX01_027595 [Papaver californicum]|nr:hypothetical protein MKX01_027595 [Papaver californicum]